jgi:hypothetical protein
MNIKTGRMAEIEQVQGRQYGWLAPFLIGGCPDGILEAPDTMKAPEGARWQDVFVHLTLTAQTYLISGWVEPARHKTAHHTMKCLFELGLPREEAAKALYRANTLKGPDQELSPRDLEHILESAGYKKSLDNES